MTSYGEVSLERMVRAVEKVRERLLRSTAILERAGIPYAVAGGNAVAAWVSRVDEAALRFTQDVDLLVRREDLPQIKTAFEQAGFVYRHTTATDMFLDGPHAKDRDAVHLVFSGEKVRAEYLLPTASVEESEPTEFFRVLTLEALVRMKLTSYRRKDQVHITDMLDVGLIDSSWTQRFPSELAERLQHLIDTPEG